MSLVSALLVALMSLAWSMSLLASDGTTIDTNLDHGNPKLFAPKIRGAVSLQNRLCMSNNGWAATYTNTLVPVFGQRITETVWYSSHPWLVCSYCLLRQQARSAYFTKYVIPWHFFGKPRNIDPLCRLLDCDRFGT